MCIAPENGQQPSVELADVFRLHGDAYCQAHQLTPEQYRVLNAIKNCRTNVLGGHAKQCDHCGEILCAYNSCRNRHCPKCESFKAATWVEARRAELLPIPYFHVVFTLPHELNNLVLYNKKVLYDLLFQATWETLKTLGADPKRLNGEMGMLAILHTWGQTLSQHNHLHCIVPGGALKKNGQWQCAKNYLFPVKVLSKLFRGIYVTQLRAAYEKNQIIMPPDPLTKSICPQAFDRLLDQLMNQDWVVYAKAPFAGPDNLLKYLARYTHKIAISNHRILTCDEQYVTFKWRDYSDGNKEKIMKLEAWEFIRRYLSHVLPHGFMRIRAFGFLANACKAKKIAVLQKQLRYRPPKPVKKDIVTRMLELTGKDITRCSICQKGKLRRICDIPAQISRMRYDTS